MPFPPKVVLSLEDELAICAVYRVRSNQVRDICARFGITSARLYAILRRRGEPLRKRVARRAVGALGVPPLDPSAPRAAAGRGPAAHRDRIRQIENVMSAQMAALQSQPVAPGAADGERMARALAQYAGALTRLRTYGRSLDEECPPDDDGPPPRSLAELRDELQRHLERIRDERRSARLSGQAEPG